jgi:hypothetical protein
MVCRRRKLHAGIIVETSEGKKPLGKTKCEWEDNIKMCIQEK